MRRLGHQSKPEKKPGKTFDPTENYGNWLVIDQKDYDDDTDGRLVAMSLVCARRAAEKYVGKEFMPRVHYTIYPNYRQFDEEGNILNTVTMICWKYTGRDNRKNPLDPCYLQEEWDEKTRPPEKEREHE